MMSRYHLTTIYADSSRPNTPKQARIFAACGGYLISTSKTFPVNFHLPSSIKTPTPDRTPAHSIPPRPGHGIRRHGRRAVLSRCNSTRRNHLIIIGQALVPCAGSRQCRMQRRAALRRATRSASASAESGAVSKPKPQRRQWQPRHPGQLGPGPGPQQQQPNRENTKKRPPLGAVFLAKGKSSPPKKSPPGPACLGSAQLLGSQQPARSFDSSRVASSRENPKKRCRRRPPCF